MPASFPRTLRHLSSEAPTRVIWSVLGSMLVLTALMGWLVLARIAVVESSTEARIELREAVHPIVASSSGRVVGVELTLGAETKMGETLVELDAELERRRMLEARRRQEAVGHELLAVGRQIEARAELLRRTRDAALQAVEVAKGYEGEARVVASLAEEELRRDERAGETIPELERVRSRAAERRAQAVLRARASESSQAAADQRVQEGLRWVELEQLRREAVALEGEAVALEANIEVLAQQLEARRIRAAADGRIGALVPIQVGSVLSEGEHLGSIVDDGELEIVASLPVARALGRVHEGQRARLRLDAFPWTEFGAVEARVRHVASEQRDGMLVVELEVLSASRITLQHGLTGVVEIEVERVSPARLLLRAAGGQ